MPYSIPTIYLVIGGNLPGGEQWQCGFHAYGTPDGPTQQNLQAAADGAIPKVQAFWASSGIGGTTCAGYTLNRITAYRIPANATKASQVATAVFTPLAGSGSQKLPNQCAVVASLRTGNPGRKGKGRFYLPVPGLTLGDWQMSAAVTTDIATSCRNLVQGLASVDAIGPIYGGTSGSPVNAVVVDSVVDTQRRRRNSLRATTTATLPVTGV